MGELTDVNLGTPRDVIGTGGKFLKLASCSRHTRLVIRVMPRKLGVHGKTYRRHKSAQVSPSDIISSDSQMVLRYLRKKSLRVWRCFL